MGLTLLAILAIVAGVGIACYGVFMHGLGSAHVDYMSDFGVGKFVIAFGLVIAACGVEGVIHLAG